MNIDTAIHDIDEYLASQHVPEGYEDCVVARIAGLYIWMRPDELRKEDQVCFYNGDLRDVLLKTDPRVKNLFQ